MVFFVSPPVMGLPGVSPVSPWDFPRVSPWISPGFPRGRPRLPEKVAGVTWETPGRVFPGWPRGAVDGASFAAAASQNRRVFPHEALMLMVLPCFFRTRGGPGCGTTAGTSYKRKSRMDRFRCQQLLPSEKQKIQVNVCMNDLSFQTS